MVTFIDERRRKFPSCMVVKRLTTNTIYSNCHCLLVSDILLAACNDLMMDQLFSVWNDMQSWKILKALLFDI